jgi:hypothetical protein
MAPSRGGDCQVSYNRIPSRDRDVGILEHKGSINLLLPLIFFRGNEHFEITAFEGTCCMNNNNNNNNSM